MKKPLFALVALLAAALCARGVTLNVNAPTATSACFVVGDFNGWDPTDGVRLQKTGAGTFTLTMDDVTESQLAKGYKYVCGPGWAYVEKGPNGEEISNRTSVGNPDVVASWAALYELNENIRTATLTVNGYQRKVEILLPDDYDSSNALYPVIYYVGVQQRYNNAGSDSDAGDNLMSATSWGLGTSMPEAAAATGRQAIVVSTYSFVAENIPYPNPDFMGSGASDGYLDSFMATVMKYVNDNFRTDTRACATTIMGADLGGVLATYAALRHPGVFGQCVAVSPMYWTCDSQLQAAAAGADTSTDFIIAYGTAEPAVMADGVAAMAAALPSASVFEIAGGTHDDDTWGQAFPSLYSYMAADAAGRASVKGCTAAAKAPRMAADIATTDYQVYSAIGSSEPATLSPDSEAVFSLVDNFRKGSADVTAKVAVREIPASVKTKYFWNVARLPEGDYLMSSSKNVSFSSKKSNTSWLRIVILEGETVENVAASSAGFTVNTSAGSTKMTAISGTHSAKADVAFTTTDKTFTIHYGSVNSESDMGAITSTLAVSDNCTAATLVYDFETNRVDITETDWGEILGGDIEIATFSAVPSFTKPGTASTVTIVVNDATAYDATLKAALNYGTASAVALTPAGTNCWTATIPDLQAGIYTLSLSLSRGSASVEDIASINIKVMDTGVTAQQSVTVNAYSDVDWNTVNQYKGNFHTHTSQSFDTAFRTDQVVDRYHNAGYSILALTDHDANPYPWSLFDLYNPEAQARAAETLGMLAIPGVELSKDNRNTWNESTGGEFNHHNDFFTGRKGQEFATLRESYAYTASLGGMQIINHPGQYWNLSTTYSAGAKNSPDWHAENFKMYPSLVGLEVYNQGNRRPNDRILWDQILDRTMPERPVWGYSCDDTHTAEQYFRNYDFMLMPELTLDALKEAMAAGSLYFCYEYTGSGQGLAPRISRVTVDNEAHTITVDTDATDISWISSTDKSGGNSTRKSTVVGKGKTFDFTGFGGKYVRALITNAKGETCTQPFGFAIAEESAIESVDAGPAPVLAVTPNPAATVTTVTAGGALIESIDLWSLSGTLVSSSRPAATAATVDVSALPAGIYLVSAVCDGRPMTAKLVVAK